MRTRNASAVANKYLLRWIEVVRIVLSSQREQILPRLSPSSDADRRVATFVLSLPVLGVDPFLSQPAADK